MQQDRQRLFCRAIPTEKGTWTLESFNPDTDEFETVGVAVGQVSENDARQLVRAGKARRDAESFPHIVLKSGKRLLVKY